MDPSWILLIFVTTVWGRLRDPSPYGYRIEWFQNMPIDHFSFVDNRTFTMRYLVNDTFFTKDGPIFFYCGNEGGIETFAQNTVRITCEY